MSEGGSGAEHRTGDGPSRVLVGVDESETAGRALAWAFGLARRSGAQLLVVTVRPRPLPDRLSGPDVDDWLAREEREVARLRRVLTEEGAVFAVPWELLVFEGNPFRELVETARDRAVDLVVIGSSEQIAHRLAGSMASKLPRAVRCPVTVVP